MCKCALHFYLTALRKRGRRGEPYKSCSPHITSVYALPLASASLSKPTYFWRRLAAIEPTAQVSVRKRPPRGTTAAHRHGTSRHIAPTHIFNVADPVGTSALSIQRILFSVGACSSRLCVCGSVQQLIWTAPICTASGHLPGCTHFVI